MPGFLGVLNYDDSIHDGELFGKMEEKNLINDSIQHKNLYVERRTVKKFQNDKFLKENQEYIILVEGVIFNLAFLKSKYKENDFFRLVIKLREENGENFFKNFKGCFSGLLFEKQTGTVFIFTDQLGTKSVYFTQNEKNLVFGSEIKYILENLHLSKIKYELDEDAVYPLLTYGFLLEDKTLINGIKKLEHGNYLKITKEKMEIKSYFELYEGSDQSYTFDEAIEKLDILFQNSIKLLLEKNREYGYKNVLPLSAGLDSRTANYVVKEMTNEEVVNITYSQSGFYDNTIPIKIASDLKNRVYYMNLDNGLSYIKNFEREIKKSEGQYHVGIGVMLFDFLENFDMDNVGVVITGVSGDCVIGTSINHITECEFKIDKKTAMYATSFTEELVEKTKFHKDYVNEEDFRVNNTDLGNMRAYFETFQCYCEAYSPFLDIDLIKFCYSLPIEYRIEHKLYYKWIERKHPQILKYPRNGRKIKIQNMPTIKILGRRVKINQIHLSAWSYFKRTFLKNKSGNYSMNPVDTWYFTNCDLKHFFDMYFMENIDLIKNHEKLYLKCKNVYENSNNVFGNKILILSLLGFCKEFLINSRK